MSEQLEVEQVLEEMTVKSEHVYLLWGALGVFWDALGCSGGALGCSGVLWDALGVLWGALGSHARLSG